jgi:hypothetical protein
MKELGLVHLHNPPPKGGIVVEGSILREGYEEGRGVLREVS